MRIVVTFSNLVHDIRLIACADDEVDYLVPPGLDPHDYELRPGDIEKLRRADLIVSTAHTPFEVSVRKMVSEGSVRARLMEIPSVKGIRIYENPSTGQPNYHMPIYDPLNYLAFMRELRDVLKELNPSRSETYDRNYLEVEERIRSMMAEAHRMNATALASTPMAQYALEWLGVRVRFLLMKDEGLPVTPSELSEIYRAARSGEIDLVVTVGDERTQANLKAIEISEEFGIRRVNIPSPLEGSSIPDKLDRIVRSLGEGIERGKSTQGDSMVLVLIPVALALLVVYLLRRRIK